MARRLFRDPRERMQERKPRIGPPVPNQKGMSAPVAPAKKPFVPNRAGSQTGRPKELRATWVGSIAKAGRKSGFLRRGKDESVVGALRRQAEGDTSVFKKQEDKQGQMRQGTAQVDRVQDGTEERQPMVGPPQLAQKAAEEAKPREKEAEAQQIIDPKTKRPVQPLGQGVQQILGGKDPKPEFTVTRNLDVKEIQNAPDGIINTPNATIEKEANGRITLRGLTELGRERIELERQKQLKDFGAWPGADDPSAPPPPVRPGGHSFNPLTGSWVKPSWVIAGGSITDILGGV